MFTVIIDSDTPLSQAQVVRDCTPSLAKLGVTTRSLASQVRRGTPRVKSATHTFQHLSRLTLHISQLAFSLTILLCFRGSSMMLRFAASHSLSRQQPSYLPVGSCGPSMT